jgi:hypothetical protein
VFDRIICHEAPRSGTGNGGSAYLEIGNPDRSNTTSNKPYLPDFDLCRKALIPIGWTEQIKLRTLDPDRQASVAMASIPLTAKDHALVAF